MNFQKKVDESIIILGGYWKPLSALARVIEEVGEVGELIYQESSQNEYADELSDVFIITTCLANQYCADLNIEYKNLGYTGNIEKLRRMINPNKELISSFINLVNQTGKIARIINHYEGDKKKKEGEENSRLSTELARLHLILFEIAEIKGINIFERISLVLEKNLKRDKGRFDVLSDPTTNFSLKRFNNLVKKTDCIFATSAKVWSAPDFNSAWSIERNLEGTCEVLKRFNKCAESEGLDGLVIEIYGENHGKNISELSVTVNRVLRYLSDKDPTGIHCMEKNILDSKWRFSFGGQTFFITVFAPCYPVNHPRYSHNDNSTFIFLQPEFSFDHHGISSANVKRDAIKEKIRKKFKDNGSAYNVNLVKQNIEVYKYVKPLNIDDSPIEWWKAKQLQYV